MISLWNHPQDYSAEIQPFDLYFNFGVAKTTMNYSHCYALVLFIRFIGINASNYQSKFVLKKLFNFSDVIFFSIISPSLLTKNVVGKLITFIFFDSTRFSSK